MALSIQQKREKIASCYPGSVNWQYRVSHMRPAQVCAIYERFKKSNRFTKITGSTKGQLGGAPQTEEYHQLTIFEVWPELLNNGGNNASQISEKKEV